MKRILVFVVLLLLLTSTMSFAELCKMKPLDPVTNVRWNCVLPITVASVPFGTSGNPIADKMDKTVANLGPICICKAPIKRIGLTIGYREPFRVIETTVNPFCLPMIGTGLDASLFNKGVKKPEQDSSSNTEQSNTIKVNTHFWISPFFLMLNIATDIACLSYDNSFTSLALGYMSEFDPTKNSSMLSVIMHPETLLFANPIAAAGCQIPQAIAKIAETSIDPLFWCLGGNNSVYPLSNILPKGVNSVGGMQSVAAKLVYFMHRNFQLFGSYGNKALCGFYPQPFWRQAQYRLQNAQPVPHWHCTPVGQTGLMWSWTKDPPAVPGATDMSWILWRNVSCCFF